MVHFLKTLPGYFENTLRGAKPFEIRKYDRKFEVGDVLVLREWDGANYTGREIRGTIVYILSDRFEGLARGFVAMSLVGLQAKRGEMWYSIRNTEGI